MIRIVNALAVAAFIASSIALVDSWQGLREAKQLVSSGSFTKPPSIRYLELDVELAELQLAEAKSLPASDTIELATARLFALANPPATSSEEVLPLQAADVAVLLAEFEERQVPLVYHNVILQSLDQLDDQSLKGRTEVLRKRWESASEPTSDP